MLEIELAALASLNDRSRRRFTWLTQARLGVAQHIAESVCFGVGEVPALDRHLQLTEETLLNMVSDLDLAAEIAAEYAVRDAAMIHGRGAPPADFPCSVCSGAYSLDQVLSRIPSID